MKKTIVYFGLWVNLVLVVASFLFNMGWLRVFALGLFVPYTIVLTIINFLYVSKCFKNKFSNKNIKPLILSNGFYLLANIVLPDYGDEVESYTFFGLIEKAPDFLILVSLTCAIVHIVFLYLSIKEMKKMRKIQ